MRYPKKLNTLFGVFFLTQSLSLLSRAVGFFKSLFVIKSRLYTLNKAPTFKINISLYLLEHCDIFITVRH